MPPGRSTRPRLVSNENEENTTSTRMTRAKAAALNVDELAMPLKGALQSKSSSASMNKPALQRKRAALGDVSNVGKGDVADVKKGAAASKVGLVSKAAHPTGVQKATSRATTRATLSNKDVNKAETKRSGSGAGAIAPGPKRKNPSSTSTSLNVKDEASVDEARPARKKAHTLGSDKLVHHEPLVEDKVLESVPAPAQAPAPAPAPAAAPAQATAPAPKVDEAPPAAKERARLGPVVLDKEELTDPLTVAEYANDIFEYLRDLEVSTIPNPEYMDQQDDLEWKTRGILIDWLIEVHTSFHLLPETLFLTVNIIDRFLSAKVVQLDRLQLVGITAMFIASKYEEVMSPHVENFKRITDNGFSEAEILSAERYVLNTLGYDLSYPNPMNFLRRVSTADNYDIQSRTIGKYLLEIILLDHRFMSFRPSHVAAAAMYLARLMLGRGDWNEALEHYAGYTEEEVIPVMELMVDYLARPVVHEAFFKKYASKKFLKASILARQWAKRNADLFGVTDMELSLHHIA